MPAPTPIAQSTPFPARAAPAPVPVGGSLLAAAATPATAPINTRMTLGNITRGRIARAIMAMVFGVEGVGKSSLGAAAPEPIFLCAESGTAELDVQRYPEPRTWADVMAALQDLLANDHQFKTLVVDTVDWLEPLLWAHICEKNGKPNIEAFAYGKGFTAALDEWRLFFAAISRLRDRGMNILLLAHCDIKPFKNPEGPDYDRYQMKLNKAAGAFLREAMDACLFATFETVIQTDEKTERSKGYGTGKRLLYTTRTPAYDAKNRWNLPASVRLSWSALMEAIRVSRALRDDTEAAIRALPDSGGKKEALEWIREPRTAAELTEMKNRAEAALAGATAAPQQPKPATDTATATATTEKKESK